MKSLTDDQILTAKEQDRQGRQKITPSENYENIYNRERDSFRDLKQIAEILEDIEKHAHRFENARKIIELFGPKKFEPILRAIFPTREQEGAPIDDRTLFEETKINVEKAIFASTLLKFSGDYLLQAFPQQEYPNLHTRILDLIKDLEGLVDAFNRIKALKNQVEEFRKHTEHFQPVGLTPSLYDYAVMCRYCKVRDNGKSQEEAVFKIKHLEECQFLEIENKESREIWSNWIELLPPSNLVISWDERKKLDKLK